MKKIITSLALLFTIAGSGFCQSKEKQLDQLIKKYVAADQFSGVVLVAEKGKPIFEKAYSIANREWNIPNTKDTKFRIGSVSKQFGVAIILQLVDEGKIKLDGKITDYIPEYPSAAGSKITIHQLLTHTSGVKNYTDLPEYFQNLSGKEFKPLDFIKIFWDLELDFEPGTNWNYSNTGYFILGCIIEKVTGKSYEENLQSRIFDPLKMNDSGLESNKTIYSEKAEGYNYGIDEWTKAAYINMTTVFTPGGIYSTAEDMLKWENGLLGGKIVSPLLLEKMNSPLVLTTLGAYYGYGRMTSKYKSATMKDSLTIIEHGGSIPGFNALLATIPKTKTTIILLRNHLNGPLNAIRTGIIQVLNNEKPDDPKTDASILFANTYKNRGLAEAVKKYRNMKIENNSNYTFNEDALNLLGYKYQQRKQLDAAVSVFELNCELNPKSSNAWDSYGEGLYNAKRLDESKIAYKKSLELDPANQNAVDYLEKMGEKVEKKEVKVDPAVYEKLTGKYELVPGFIITVTTDGKGLFAQATGQSQFELFPKSETEFYLKVVNAQISFLKADSGKITDLILHQGGRDQKGKKIE